MSNERKGVYGKYLVLSRERIGVRGDLFDTMSGVLRDHAETLVEPCFVLRADRDVHARKALEAYANSCSAENPELAGDIRNLLIEHEREAYAGVVRAARGYIAARAGRDEDAAYNHLLTALNKVAT